MTWSAAVCILIILVQAAVCAYVILIYRRRTEALMHRILHRINEAIAGNDSCPQYNESMESAIDEKLNHFLTISKETKAAAKKERDRIKTFVADVSHQTKTPLSNILLYTQLLSEKEELDEETRFLSSQIQSQADKLDFLLKSLTKSSHLEADLISLSPCRQSVDKLVLLTCQQWEIYALRRNISIAYEECGLDCLFDMKWTLEALGNVLDNAIKYSPKGSRIGISATPYEMFLRIDVKDNGLGIEQAEQGLIFTRFYRCTQVQKEKGLGIGLFLSREIISKENGYIKVDSSLGKGSTFSIFLPR